MQNVTILLEKLQHRIRKTFEKKVVIPTYDEKRKVIDQYRTEYKATLFVETGTFLGDTVQAFINKFDYLFSIELSNELATEAKARFIDTKNVEIREGDSGAILASLVPTLSRRSLFWLDGHYSSEFYLGDRYIKTAKGNKNTPILEELDAILSSSVQHIILIDEARLFIGKDHYPSIRSLKKKLASYKPHYKLSVEQDIIRITPD